MTPYHEHPTRRASSSTACLWIDAPALSEPRETFVLDTTNGPRPELELHVGRDLTDEERTRRLMPTIGDPSDSAHAEAMSMLDGCPTACGEAVLPDRAEHVQNGYKCHYRCTCGETWFTTWRVGG